MATVTLAEDTLLGRSVALKRMSGTADADGILRLRREALVGASVSHPNLVSVYDVLTEDEHVVIVMEYVDGHTLKEKIATERRLEPSEALRVLHGVAGALDAIHQRGIVHRDVKPPNILLGTAGEVKLADLGIAAAPDRTSITTAGSVMGSFSYMSPEQLEGAAATPAMDIYAFSAVAYEALSGLRAPPGGQPAGAGARDRHSAPTRPDQSLGRCTGGCFHAAAARDGPQPGRAAEERRGAGSAPGSRPGQPEGCQRDHGADGYAPRAGGARPCGPRSSRFRSLGIRSAVRRSPGRCRRRGCGWRRRWGRGRRGGGSRCRGRRRRGLRTPGPNSPAG